MCPMLSVGCTNELLRPAAYPVSRDTKKTPPPKNHHESATEASQPPKTSTLKVQPWKHPQNTNTTSATPTLDCRMQKHDQQSAANTASARLPQCKVKIWSQNLSVWPNRKTIRPWYHEKDTPKPVRSQRLNQSPSPRDTLYWKTHFEVRPTSKDLLQHHKNCTCHEKHHANRNTYWPYTPATKKTRRRISRKPKVKC